MKLKDFKNKWVAIRLSDRTILRGDLSLMSAEQIESLMQINVVPTKANGYFRAVEEEGGK